MATHLSPFLDPGLRTKPDTLGIVLLSRDQFQPLYLREFSGEVDGYVEGDVLNTRFGSFPHSTLLNVPWGTQVRASVVDTGTRGRKRKRDEGRPGAKGVAAAAVAVTKQQQQQPKGTTVTAASGFIHILPPTPEIWTLSLPHRTQVVYTSDYSYILHRLRARPGSRIIEAGSGSGSFTHASARAVYNGNNGNNSNDGAVFSFEFHNERYGKMKKELASHGLNGLVTLTNRDVYEGGFLMDDGSSPEADAVFLDLPAPWRALPHLTRQKTSALNPRKSVHLCTFSPCIEQVTRTVSTLRRLGWVDIDMVEVANKKLIVYRERPETVGGRGGSGPAPHDVLEAVARLKTIEARTREYNTLFWQQRAAEEDGSAMVVEGEGKADSTPAQASQSTAQTTLPLSEQTPPWMEGLLTTRVEPEVKTHTSYLVFAVLPREWTAEDEAAAAARWPCGNERGMIGAVNREARKEQKRRTLQGRSGGGGGGGGGSREGT
ncbi:tRNA methyltransferase subunit [Grosmannia clavigera kw1407]|uniref:tRNA (adenine(58)-N(1))-methyltransferase catalytic subunit TRM61 n=1 Tax=Grosmannia clavigera (strain kw1407 / UAMH 11150) TaxID=655863 RepID=F0XNZ1_GROCL|nr:tRNA methyltransferase subunit [Grosmannia clavigera kw1407]EFX00676.1 tRNA methyltransferase subunit [Grosmannia clavigera kw1407]